jgi:uncharacterized SAM-binding protein YcdF (DUF218 family)
VRRILAALAVLVGLAYVGREPLLQAVGSFLVVNDDLRAADAVITIGGNGPERVARAIELLGDGYGRYLIVSGGPYGGGRNSALIMQRQALAAGLSAERILVDDRAQSTADNAVGSAALMKDRRLRSAILLTSPYHTRRAAVVFSRVFGRQGLAVRVLAVDDRHFRVERWWTREFERRLVIGEYVKLLASWGGVR